MLECAEREVFGASIRAEPARAAASEGKPPLPHLQPHPYPHLLAALMSSARAYDDPHGRTSPSPSSTTHATSPPFPTFSAARRPPTTSSSRLAGTHFAIYTALEEMRVNGVSPDQRTRAFVDNVRREIGARTVWLEGSVTGSGEVWTMLGEIERLVARRKPLQALTNDHRPYQ
jgi:hypothetical protein